MDLNLGPSRERADAARNRRKVLAAAEELFAARGVAAWDLGKAPRAARIAGLLSLALWAAVVLLGRWIGFTKGYDFTIPPGVELEFPIR